jgi:hypothetical protein
VGKQVGTADGGERMGTSEEPVYYADHIEPVYRSSSDELFFLTIEARPEPEVDEYGKAGGAFVSCWVNTDDLRTAERKAVTLIHGHGWRSHRFDEWKLVTRATYVDRDDQIDEEIDLRELVEQAFIDGEVCVFNCWPMDAPDADEQ